MMSVLSKTLVILATSTLLASFAQAEEAAHGEKADASHHSLGFPQPVADRAKATLPSMTELVEPKAFAKVPGNTTTLKWTAVKEATHYVLQVATDANFKWLVKNESIVKDTSYNLTGLEAGQMYFWRVASNAEGNSPGYTQSRFKASSFETAK